MTTWKVPLAHYRCQKCGYEWKQIPEQGSCINCGHDYVDWINFEEWRREAARHDSRLLG